MSNEPFANPPIPPLKAAYAAAVLAHGRDKADAVLQKHDGKPGAHGWRSVPRERVPGCIAEMEKLVLAAPTVRKPPASKTKREAFAKPDPFAAVRAKAFGDSKPKPEAPKTINAADVYARWNSTPVRNDQNSDLGDGGEGYEEYMNP